MASSASRGGGERMIHQDFIARIRFSNALPPPPNPPKLLDIPNTGLSSGQYTTPSFATRLFREQAVNIEADAELGMPLDLVGMPGIFEGDENSIQAPVQTPPVHPHDRQLLRPLSTLGKPKTAEASVSFLRRTEYISSVQAKKNAAEAVFLKTSSGNQARRPQKRRSPSPELDRDSPAYIKRRIEKSFEAVAANLKDHSRVKHPSKRNATLLDAYPMLPDLDAFPDTGAYVTLKFANNPVPSASAYDTRLLSAVFMPIDRTEAEEEAYAAALHAHEADPAHNAKPPNAMNYDLFLADTAGTAANFRRKWDIDNPERNDDALYTRSNTEGPCFQFGRVRAYETAEETEQTHATKYDREIVLSLTDDAPAGAVAADARGRAVWYYPVMQRSVIRSQRTKNIARGTGAGVMPTDEEQVVDQLDITVREPTEDMHALAAEMRENPLRIGEEGDHEEEHNETPRPASQGREVSTPGDSGIANGNHIRETVELDEDAEGDEE